jgi:hypothetical protein
VNRAYGTTDGPGLITFFIAEMLERGDQRDLLDGTGMPAKIDLIREATLIDAFFQSLISELLSLPSVSFQEDHLALRAAFLSHIKRDDTVGPEEKSRADVVRLAMQCFEQTEIALPAVIPRHPEQILELRQKLKGDLDEFREKLKGLAKELADTKPETSIRDIKRCVEKNLIDEVKKLDKKLAKPLRELRREFFAMAPGMAGIGLGVGILLSALLLDGHAALQTLSGMSSTLLSALGALGAAASKVQTEKQRKIEGSDVAFLIRAKDDIQKA